MGTGKTTVGKLLAKRLRREFVEMDEEIEKREKKKIVDIFSQYGEAYFRKVEKNMLREISQKDNLVISCGGGIVIDEENIRVMKGTGVMVCLEATPEVIYQRTKKDTHRPLLNVPDPLSRIKELLSLREPYYQKAEYFLDTSNISPEEIVEKIVELLKNDKKISIAS